MIRLIRALLFILLTSLSAKADPSALLAYSLRESERQLRGGTPAKGQLVELGGIKRVVGLVYDRENQDVILVGRTDSLGAPLDLSNLVVAMRSVLKNQWPAVSIDPTPETQTTQKQRVRFEGDIANTKFGGQLLAADVALKKLGLGLLRLKGLEVLSYFDLCASDASEKPVADQGSNRFWFYPLDVALEQREDVFAVRELRIGVRAETVNVAGSDGKQIEDEAAQRFSEALTTSFDKLTLLFPEIGRLQGLYQMVALAKGLESLPEVDLNYWLQAYKVDQAETPSEFGVISRSEQVKTVGGVRSLQVSGGIQLKALLLRLEDGDITALKEAVLMSRPNKEALTWEIALNTWQLRGGAATTMDSKQPSQPTDFGSSLTWKLNSQPGTSGLPARPMYEPIRHPRGQMLDLSRTDGQIFRDAPEDVTVVSPPSKPGTSVIELPGTPRPSPRPTSAGGQIPRSGTNETPKAKLDNAIAEFKEALEKTGRNQSIQLKEYPLETGQQAPPSVFEQVSAHFAKQLPAIHGTASKDQGPSMIDEAFRQFANAHPGISGSASSFLVSSTKVSPDGKLRAVLNWKVEDTFRRTGTWTVHDDSNGGRVVKTGLNEVELLNDGKFKVLVEYGKSAFLSPSGQATDLQWKTYTADKAVSGTAPGTSASTASPARSGARNDPRGGVKADIRIDDKDFEAAPRRKSK